MIRIAVSQAAFEAIAATLPLGSVGYEAQFDEKGERLIWLESHVLNKLRFLRGPGESYSDVILRIAKQEVWRVTDEPPPRPYLREWREARGMTQQALADAAGLTVSDIARYETERAGMKMEVQFVFMHALDLTPAYFFCHPDEPNGWTSCPPLPPNA